MTRRARFLLAILGMLVVALAVKTYFWARPIARPAVPPINDEEVVSRFIDLYLNIQAPTRWLGASVQQTPTDLWALQEIIAEVRPDLIVETGTYQGGSALYMASVLQCVNPAGRIITVDIEDLVKEARLNPLFDKYVTTLIGSSVDPAIVSKIRELAAGRRTLVFLDSDHHAYHVIKELAAYADLVSVGSYVIVNDTFFDKHAAPPGYKLGPIEAVKKFLASRDDFVKDTGRARFMLSFYPDGYLKRIK